MNAEDIAKVIKVTNEVDNFCPFCALHCAAGIAALFPEHRAVIRAAYVEQHGEDMGENFDAECPVAEFEDARK